MSEILYKCINGIYSLYNGGELIYDVGEEVSLSYVYWEDEDGTPRGFINKHGSLDMVKNYHDVSIDQIKLGTESSDELMSAVSLDMLNSYHLISGKFNLEDLNRFVSIGDSIARWHKENIK